MYNSLATRIGRLLEEKYGVSTEVILTTPEHPEHGDLTTNIALKVSSLLGRTPREIAESLAPLIRGLPEVEEVEVAGPGFLNLSLTVEALIQQVQETRQACRPREVRRREAPVIIEYSQPNIAKPMGIHHILSTVIGQCLVNLYRHAGYRVISWNYLGDWGTQFGNLAVALERWGTKARASEYTLDEFLALYVRFHREAESDPTLEELGRAAFRRLEQGNPELRAFWNEVVTETKTSLLKLYERLHVSFDLDLGESFYEDKMAAVLREGERKEVFRRGKEGALVVEFPPDVGLPTYMVLKSDGATLYSTRDLAQMRYRIDTYHPQAILIVTDVAQMLYFQQLEATCRMLRWDLPHFEHIQFGRMRFPDRAMSTRMGNILKLEEVLDEAVQRAERLIKEHECALEGEGRQELAEMVGVGSLVYVILSQNRKSDLIFTWERSLTFEGNSAPYLQYTHARARSVLRKGAVVHIDPPASLPSLHPREGELLKQLSRFPQILEQARIDGMPHKLTHYLYALCQSFNALYNALPILEAPQELRTLRLALTELTADVLKVGAELLTLRVPDRM